MKKFFILLTFFFLPLPALAAGGGGGGSVTQCEQDTWICTEWSECSSQGMQKRSCSLSYDCPESHTSRPAESRACAPPCTEDTWECSPWSACSDNGTQIRTCAILTDCPNISNIPPSAQRACEKPAPAHELSPTPTPTPTPQEKSRRPNPFAPLPQATAQETSNCTQDRWDCGPWSAECDSYGNQNRSCKMTLDCATVETPPPIFFKRCEKLQCGNLPNTRDRALCRLNLTPAGLAREYEIEYLPEECRLSENQEKKQQCVRLYQSYTPCWNKQIGEERSRCARGVLGLGQSVARTISECGKNGKSHIECKAAHREKVYELIKFHFYDLEERAEDLIKKGAEKELVADFVVFITQSKERFNMATTNKERREIIVEVRREWKKFILEAKKQVKNI